MKRVITGVLGVALLAFACLLVIDMYDVGVRGADYNFGTEAMIGTGGWIYRSARTYLLADVIEVFLAVSAALGFFLSAFRSKPLAFPAGAVAALAVLLHFSAAVIH